MNIGAVTDPLNWDRWPEAEALLEPARARGEFPCCLEPDEELFAVLDGDELIAAATAWFAVNEKYVEVKLVGGRDYRRWLAALDASIGGAARLAGAVRMIAIGRKGWGRALRRLGWEEIEQIEDHWLFAKEL